MDIIFCLDLRKEKAPSGTLRNDKAFIMHDLVKFPSLLLKTIWQWMSLLGLSKINFSLLHSHELTGDLSCLDVNQHDPFTQCKSPSNQLSCFNSGSWCHQAWDNLIKSTHDWLCPVIFAIDETNVGHIWVAHPCIQWCSHCPSSTKNWETNQLLGDH